LPDHFDFFLPLAGSEVYNASNDNEADGFFITSKHLAPNRYIVQDTRFGGNYLNGIAYINFLNHLSQSNDGGLV
jgi:hypothetical protein